VVYKLDIFYLGQGTLHN